MMFYALVMMTFSKLVVINTYTTLEPCVRDAAEVRASQLPYEVQVRCVPTTELDVAEAETQLQAIHVLLGWDKI